MSTSTFNATQAMDE
jgi:hypothetical protein